MIVEILTGVAILLVGYIFYKYETGTIETVEYIIETEKIPKEFDGFTIVQIGDLHNKSFGKDNKRLLEKVDNINPDAVFITGDLVEGESKNFEVALNLIDDLTKKYEIYHIIGNHEQKSLIKKYKNLYKSYFEDLKKKNINNLNNEVVKIQKGNSFINVYGLIIPLENYKYLFNKNKNIDLENDFIQNRLGNINKNNFNLLLAHTPFYFEEYAKWGADLTLAGHVHGGIIRIPFLGGLLSPNREFFPKYDLGRYDIKNSTMILTKGLGGSKVLIRLNCRPEIVKIILKSK